MPSFGGAGRGGGGAARFAPGDKPQNSRGTARRVIGIYARSGKIILLAIGLTALSALITVAIPYFVGRAFDTFHVNPVWLDTFNLLRLLVVVAALYAANYVIGTINGLVTLNVTQKLVYQLRTDFFAKLQKLPLSFFDTRPHGDTMSRLTNDIDNISTSIASTTTQLVSAVLTILGSLAVMLVLSPPLTIAVVVSVPLVIVLTNTIAKRSRAYFLSQQRNLGLLNGEIEENIVGMKMVKAFGRRDYVMKQFGKTNENLYGASLRAQIWSGFMMPLMNVINNLIYTLVAITGGVLSISYGLPVGTVVSFLFYSKQFGQPLNSIAGMWNTIQQALAGAERVFEILDQQEETPDAPGAIVETDVAGHVTFQDVSFAYPTASAGLAPIPLPGTTTLSLRDTPPEEGNTIHKIPLPGTTTPSLRDTPPEEGNSSGVPQEKLVLKHISFDVTPGETIALVGETGAGKTTIVNLLLRFYDASTGEILIDGVPITGIVRDSLRRCFSVVLQDTSLFTGTILDNIAYSRPDATEDEVIAAAKLAHAHEFIEKLPRGYQTTVSGSSDNLSEGQRQLLAIARAVLSDSPILILDEATSSVDTKTEKDIQRALLALMSHHTSFLIAHRLSTIRDADRIMVIGDGQILESGNHAELMANQGPYYEMVVSQMGVIKSDAR